MIDKKQDTRRFKLEHTAGVAISDDELVADMRRVAVEFGAGSLPSRLYESRGKYSSVTARERFGSWNAALMVVGLPVLHVNEVTDDDLFGNLEQMWVRMGRQPRRRELVPPMSRFSQAPYNRRFGSWRQALEEFVLWADSSSDEAFEPVDTEHGKRRTPRDPNSALRWRVANRDGFRCRHCGKSPANTPGVILHFDHIVPWSNGGDTVFENLQTLCSKCNLGKGTQHQSAEIEE